MAISYSIPFGVLTTIESFNSVAPGVTFTFEPDPAATEFSAIFMSTGGTTLSADLQASSDGGTTWFNYSGTATLTNAAPTKIFPASGTTPLICGLLFRFNYTTLTGGPVTVRVQSN